MSRTGLALNAVVPRTTQVLRRDRSDKARETATWPRKAGEHGFFECDAGGFESRSAMSTCIGVELNGGGLYASLGFPIAAGFRGTSVDDCKIVGSDLDPARVGGIGYRRSDLGLVFP